jgi:hypothetical protein
MPKTKLVKIDKKVKQSYEVKMAIAMERQRCIKIVLGFKRFAACVPEQIVSEIEENK